MFKEIQLVIYIDPPNERFWVSRIIKVQNIIISSHRDNVSIEDQSFGGSSVPEPIFVTGGMDQISVTGIDLEFKFFVDIQEIADFKFIVYSVAVGRKSLRNKGSTFFSFQKKGSCGKTDFVFKPYINNLRICAILILCGRTDRIGICYGIFQSCKIMYRAIETILN